MPVAYDTPIRTNAQNLERILGAGLPVLISLEMPRCEPCSVLDEPFKVLARSYAGQVLIVRVEDSSIGGLLERFGVKRIPTLLLWHGGRVAGRIEGAAGIEDLRQNLEYLSGKVANPTPASGRSVPAPGRDPLPLPNTNPRSGDTTGARSAENADGSPVVVNDASFERDVLHYHLPVLVDFWAPWCGPCRMVSPIVEELGRTYQGRLRVAKVNTDENPRYASSLGIRGIPTLILFKNGREIDRLTGAAPKPTLQNFIERNLK